MELSVTGLYPDQVLRLLNVGCQGSKKLDDFVKNPISALRFIPQSLRRTGSTPHSTGFVRFELGLFTKSSPSGAERPCAGLYFSP
jgi:hypothetical protein